MTDDEHDEDEFELDPDLLFDIPNDAQSVDALVDYDTDRYGHGLDNTIDFPSRSRSTYHGAKAPKRPSALTSNRSHSSVYKSALADELAEVVEPATPHGHFNNDLSLSEDRELSFTSSGRQSTTPISSGCGSKHPEQYTSSASPHCLSEITSLSDLTQLSNGMGDLPDGIEHSDNQEAFASDRAELQACVYAVDLFLKLLQGLLSANHTTPAPADSALSASDTSIKDTSAAEQRLSSNIKLMYELGKYREKQVEELQAFKRYLSDPDPAWQVALSEISPLSQYRKDPEQSLESLETLHAASPISPAICQIDTSHLSIVRHTTDDVLDALIEIAENVQIGRTTLNETQRKMKNIEGALQRLRSDQESIDRSQRYIELWQRQENAALLAESGANLTALPGISTSRPQSCNISQSDKASSRPSGIPEHSGRYAQIVHAELRAMQSSLELAHQQATSLLVAA